MPRFRQVPRLQKLASFHANVHNYFNLEPYLVDGSTYRKRRSADLAKWQLVRAPGSCPQARCPSCADRSALGWRHRQWRYRRRHR